MKFKTTIKIITEAGDRDEAMEIAGEYLSGNLASGVDMKFRTSPVRSNSERAGIALAVIFVSSLAVFQLSQMNRSQSFTRDLPGGSVIQPPLKTAPADKKYSDFRKEWQTRHAQEALNSLKK